MVVMDNSRVNSANGTGTAVTTKRGGNKRRKTAVAAATANNTNNNKNGKSLLMGFVRYDI